MKYQRAIYTDAPETLRGLQPGQWINHQGTIGRYMGRRRGCQWIAWGLTARKRFSTFATIYKGN